MISMTTLVYSISALITLIYFIEEITMLFVGKNEVKELAREIMPLVFISFVMESL